MTGKNEQVIIEKLRENIEQGKSLLKEGKYREAQNIFLRVLRSNARSYEAHFELGKTYYIQNKLTGAEKELKRSISINKQNKYAYILLAKAYLASKRYSLSLKILQSLKRANPELRPEVLAQEGAVYEAQGKYIQAIKAYAEAIEKGLDNAEMRLALAKVYDWNGQEDEAVEEYKEAIKRGADNKEAHFGLGETYRRKKEYDKAVTEYEQAIKMGMDNKEVHLSLGEAYKFKEEYGSAVKEFKEAIEKGADGLSVHFKISEIYYRNKQYKQAFEECIKAQRYGPTLEMLQILLKSSKHLKKYDVCLDAGHEYIRIENEEDKKYNKRLIETFQNEGKKSRDITVKIIRTPYFEKQPKDVVDHCLLLPIGVARIVSYLRSNGIKIDQDDLYIKVNHDNIFGADKDRTDREVFFDEKRVVEYMKGKKDAFIENILEKAEKKTKLKGYKVVLISLPALNGNTSGYMYVLALARYLKKKYDPLIIAGGEMTNVDDLMNYDLKDIDLVIKGKGEKPLFMILSALRYGLGINNIPDILLGNNGKLLTTGLHTNLDIIPDYNGLPTALYRYSNKRKLPEDADKETVRVIEEFNKSKILVSPFVMMEGCSHNCAFCHDSGMDYIFPLTPKRAVEHLKRLKQKYGIKYFFFLDSTINITKKYINDFCDEVISSKLDILWSDCARADNLDRETLLKMRKAGCVSLIYGMETASSRLLKYIGKEINLKRLENILAWTDEAGIWTGVEMICGFPHETKEDLDMTISFLRKNKKHINGLYNNLFFMVKDSRFDLHRKEYGLENLSNIDTYQYTDRKLKARMRIRFDEVGGFKWKEKLKYMVEGFDYLQKETSEMENLFYIYEMEHLLFYLYSKYKDKNEVLRIFNKVRNACMSGLVSKENSNIVGVC